MPEPLPLLFLGGQPTWEMPELPSLRKLPPQATFWPFPDAESALARLPERSLLVRCLSGDWDFQLFDRPGDVTANALAAGEWRTVAVPGNWTMQLRRENYSGKAFIKPHYTSSIMPFTAIFPHVPEYTATGVYRTRLTIPGEWAGQRIILHFAGCESLLYVYLDGQFVGMNKDSRTPAEYDITGLVEAGQDYEVLCVNPRYSDASYLEDQDHWRQAGIHRDVYLYATPKTYIEDLGVQAELAADFSEATLQLKASVRTDQPGQASGKISVQLFDAESREVWAEPLELTLPEPTDTRPIKSLYNPWADTATYSLDATVKSPNLWSAETPYLYTLVVTLETDRGTVSTAFRFGIRSVFVKNRELLVNGQPVMIHGMNRHDHHDETGKAVTRELMELDARTMKAYNVNAVRTSHYPNDPYWLDLCDEYGFYVYDETNIENHEWFGLADDKRVNAAYLERVRNMVERDKNHPSVIVWSLGNESGHGLNHETNAAWIRRADPRRPLFYEGGVRNLFNAPRNSNWHQGRSVTDIIGPMYPPHAEVIEFVTTVDDPRPFIICEYAHAMGNSSGSLADYYAAFEKYHGLQGGFIWEWLDHGIRMETPEGAPYWVYGGDFGDQPNDGNFVADGMVWPDRTPHPGLTEFKYLARPVRVTAVDAKQGLFQVENRRYFTDLHDLRGDWQLKVAGEVVQSGEINGLHIPPQGKDTITLPLKWPEEGEAFVEFYFTTRENTAWAEKGHLVAWDQIALPAQNPLPVQPGSARNVEVVKKNSLVKLVSDNHEVSFDAERGELISFGGTDLLEQGPGLNLWRAPTDNDCLQLSRNYGSNQRALGLWQTLGLPQLARRLETFEVKESVTVEIRHVFSGREKWDDVRHVHSYTLQADGSLAIQNEVRLAAGFADLPRLGLNLRLRPGFENLNWFGRGPGENYSDRQASSRVDHFRSTVTEQYVPYIMPQENGHKTGTRWLRLTNEAGRGLEVTGDHLFEFNALHFTDEDLSAARHTPDLKPRPEVILNLDYGMRGLGTGLIVDTLPEYRLNDLEYRFTFILKPL